jgi:hypothetical protein
LEKNTIFLPRKGAINMFNLKINFDGDQFKREITKELESRKEELATEYFAKNLSEVKCPIHGESPKNIQWADDVLHYDECCQELIKAVNNKIGELRATYPTDNISKSVY